MNAPTIPTVPYPAACDRCGAAADGTCRGCTEQQRVNMAAAECLRCAVVGLEHVSVDNALFWARAAVRSLEELDS